MGKAVAMLTFTYLPEWNGVSKHIAMLKQALEKKGWKVTVYAPTAGADVRIKALPVGFSSALLYLPFSVKEPIIHIHGFTNTLLLYALLLTLTGKKVVWTWHGIPKGPLTLPFHAIAWLFKRLKWPILSVAPHKGTLWLPNGVEEPPVSPSPISQRRGWAFIGRMDRNKNPLKAAHYFHNLFQKGDPGPFFFLGQDEGEMKKVVAFCKEKGMDCRFGFLKGKAYWELLASLKGILLCSSYEGFPLTMLEAWKVRTPFFSCTPSLKALYEAFHIDGYLSSPEDLEEWEKIARSLKGKHLPTWEEVAEKLEGIYTRLSP